MLALVVMCWSAAFNTVFDRVEYRLSGRVASDRPQRWRVLHALLHEATAVVVTWPVIVALTGFSWGAALAADLGLTAAYAAYAYGFHRLYDAWRPVQVHALAGAPRTPEQRLEVARRAPGRWRGCAASRHLGRRRGVSHPPDGGSMQV